MAQKMTPIRTVKKSNSKPVSEASVKYNLGYAKKNYRIINFKLHVEKDRELLAWLDSRESLKPYLIELIKQDMDKRPHEVQAVVDKLNEEFPLRQFDKYNLKDDERYIRCDNCDFDTVIVVEPGKVVNYRRCPKCRGIMHEALPIVELTEEHDGLDD
ncbi:MAG: hypothetical protein J6K75_00880 [Erysipelotrichaceae bacterium]|nr:hypothetical protein [Erysipelotrichaceae bacterium]